MHRADLILTRISKGRTQVLSPTLLAKVASFEIAKVCDFQLCAVYILIFQQCLSCHPQIRIPLPKTKQHPVSLLDFGHTSVAPV